MNPAVRMMLLRQGTRSIEEYVADFLELAHLTQLDEICLMIFFRGGLSEPLSLIMPLHEATWTLEEYSDLALKLSCFPFTVGVEEEENHSPIGTSTAETCHKMAADPEPHNSPAKPESALIMPAKPESALARPAKPESPARMATTPADAPLWPGLITSVLDPPLVSVRAAGIPRSAPFQELAESAPKPAPPSSPSSPLVPPSSPSSPLVPSSSPSSPLVPPSSPYPWVLSSLSFSERPRDPAPPECPLTFMLPLTCQSHLTPPLTCQSHLTPPLACQCHLTPPLACQSHLTPPLTCQSHLTPPLTCQSHLTPPLTCQSHLTHPLTGQSHLTSLLSLLPRPGGLLSHWPHMDLALRSLPRFHLRSTALLDYAVCVCEASGSRTLRGGSVTNLVASHHTTATHHPWTTTPIIHCTTKHTYPPLH